MQKNRPRNNAEEFGNAKLWMNCDNKMNTSSAFKTNKTLRIVIAIVEWSCYKKTTEKKTW